MRRHLWIAWVSFFCVVMASGVSLEYWRTRLRIPESTPLPHLQVLEDLTVLNAPGENFSFAVMGDMPFDTDARRAVLKDAQSFAPLFLCNTGDVTRYAKPKDWRHYMNFLKDHLKPGMPYFHCPGNHDVDHNVFGKQPGFFKHYFGRMRRVVDVGADWRLIFLDTSLTNLPAEERKWLSARLDEGTESGKRIILLTHFSPRLIEMHPVFHDKDEKDHALKAESTQALAEMIQGHDVAIVFGGHFNRTLQYEWMDIPVYATGMNEDTWVTESTAYYRVRVRGRTLTVETVELKAPDSTNSAP